MSFDESKHERHPEGSKQGGQFAPKAGGASAKPGEDHELSGLRFDKEQKKWLNKHGEPLDEATVARLKKIGASAGYKSISLNPDPNAPLQAWVVAQNGQIKRLYSKEHSEAASAEKFSRLRDFDKALPAISASIDKAMNNQGLSPRVRDAAATLRMIEKTGIRPGSEKELGAIKSYGATTLEGQHIKLGPGGRIDLEFVGKSGITNTRSFVDTKLHKYLSQKNLVGNQRVFLSTDDDLRDFLKRASGKPFKVKDFRTWQGTSIALREIAKMGRPTDAKSLKVSRTEIAKKVAAFLNNTPAVALANYIDPHVFSSWGKG